MNSIKQLLDEYKTYRDEADSFHYQLDQRCGSISEISKLIAGVRGLAETNLPNIVLRVNKLDIEQLSELYKAKQYLCINEYNYRKELFSFIMNPSENTKKVYNAFLHTAEVE